MLTDEEWAARNAVSGLSDDRPFDTVGFYNDYWLEQGELHERTSLIVDPPNGKLPAWTPAEEKRIAARRQYRAENPPGNPGIWTDLNVYDRCRTRGMPGAMMPGFYNHNYQILQTPDYVAIRVEMIHDTRIIPLDGRPHVSQPIQQMLGDSRGRWEGDTLVVETTNLSDLEDWARRSTRRAATCVSSSASRASMRTPSTTSSPCTIRPRSPRPGRLPCR